jgi:hypothetical protein
MVFILYRGRLLAFEYRKLYARASTADLLHGELESMPWSEKNAVAGGIMSKMEASANPETRFDQLAASRIGIAEYANLKKLWLTRNSELNSRRLIGRQVRAGELANRFERVSGMPTTRDILVA